MPPHPPTGPLAGIIVLAGCDQMAGLGQILAIVPDLDAVGPQVGGVGAVQPRNRLPEDIEELFADELRTALVPGVTAERVAALRARLNSDEVNYYMESTALSDELDLAEELLGLRAGSCTTSFWGRKGMMANLVTAGLPRMAGQVWTSPP